MLGHPVLEASMRVVLALLLALCVSPAFGQQGQRRPAQQPQAPLPGIWTSTGGNFADRFNAAARQNSLEIRAVVGACSRGSVQTSCEIRVGSLPGNLLTRNDETAIREVTVGVSGGSTAAAVDALQAFTVLLRWSAPQADDGERRAAFHALFPPGGGADHNGQVRLHGTKFSRVTIPGVGLFLFASPVE